MNIEFIKGHEPNSEQKRLIFTVLGLVENDDGELEAPESHPALVPNRSTLLSRGSPSLWRIGFFTPSEIGGQTPFAVTGFDGSVATTKIRHDAPGFANLDQGLMEEAARIGVVYDPQLHFNETIVHELGHAIFDGLPESKQLAIVKLFGANSIDASVINPPGQRWQDRVVEGMADTFKEAFLPADSRVFPNRTNQRIDYGVYNKFRHLFRNIGGGGFSYVYGGSKFRVDLSPYGLIRLPYHRSNRDPEAFVFYEEIEGFTSCWGVDMSQFAESGHHPFSIEPVEIESS